MRDLVVLLRQSLVMEFTSPCRVEAKVELVFPTKLEPRLGQCVVTLLRARAPLGKICGVRCDLAGDDAVAHVILVG